MSKYTHFEVNNAKVVLDTDNEQNASILIYNRNGDCITSVAISPKANNVNIFGNWDVAK